MNLLHACFAIFAFGLVYANSDEGLVESKIFGGYPIFNRSYFSYQASIRYPSDVHHCGGVLYDNLHVLTAASCFVDATNLSQITVVLGNLNRSNAVDHAVVRSVTKMKLHEEFDKTTTYENNIAILTLNETVTFNANISSIPLWDDVHPPNETLCVISGWGLGGSPQYSTWLVGLDVNYISNTTCKSIYGDRFNNGMICAAVEGDKGPCRGDYGGPLVCNKQLLGLISWSNGCGALTDPEVYTDIPYYISWIKDNTRL